MIGRDQINRADFHRTHRAQRAGELRESGQGLRDHGRRFVAQTLDPGIVERAIDEQVGAAAGGKRKQRQVGHALRWVFAEVSQRIERPICRIDIEADRY